MLVHKPFTNTIYKCIYRYRAMWSSCEDFLKISCKYSLYIMFIWINSIQFQLKTQLKKVSFKQMENILLWSLYLASKIHMCGIKLLTKQFTAYNKCFNMYRFLLAWIVFSPCQNEDKKNPDKWVNQPSIYFCDFISRIHILVRVEFHFIFTVNDYYLFLIIFIWKLTAWNG